MNKKMEPMKLVFTSYRDSVEMNGLKVSLDRHAPKPCSYPTMTYLIMPVPRNLTASNTEQICNAILDNNWKLILDFIMEMHGLGIRQIILCDWSTKEQIAQGKFCPANIIGLYIQSKSGELEFPIEVKYGDGREAL